MQVNTEKQFPSTYYKAKRGEEEERTDRKRLERGEERERWQKHKINIGKFPPLPPPFPSLLLPLGLLKIS